MQPGLGNGTKAVRTLHRTRIPAILYYACLRQPVNRLPDVLPGRLRPDCTHAQSPFTAQSGGANLRDLLSVISLVIHEFRASSTSPDRSAGQIEVERLRFALFWHHFMPPEAQKEINWLYPLLQIFYY